MNFGLGLGGRNIEVNYQTRRRRLVKDSTVTGEKEAAGVFSTKLTTAAKSEPPIDVADPVAQFLEGNKSSVQNSAIVATLLYKSFYNRFTYWLHVVG